MTVLMVIPLNSLMQDQVMNLRKNGINAFVIIFQVGTILCFYKCPLVAKLCICVEREREFGACASLAHCLSNGYCNHGN